MPINPLKKRKRYNLSEAYEVIRTAVVVMDHRTYRIEVLRDWSIPKTQFTTRCWVEEDVTVQPTYPQDSMGFGRKPQDMSVWSSFDLPSVRQMYADRAMAGALGFLSDQAKVGAP